MRGPPVVILAFWLFLAYDLFEDRRTIEVLIKTLFPLCFKMAERFENLDNFTWLGERKDPKKSSGCIGQVLEAGGKKRPLLFLENDSKKKNTRATTVFVGSPARLNQKQNLISKLTLM